MARQGSRLTVQQIMLDNLDKEFKDHGIDQRRPSGSDPISHIFADHVMTDLCCEHIDKVVQHLEQEFEMDRETPICLDYFSEDGDDPKEVLMHLVKNGLALDYNFYNREQLTEKLRSHGIQVFTRLVQGCGYAIKLTRCRPSSLTENDTIVHDDCNLFGMQHEFMMTNEMSPSDISFSDEEDDKMMKEFMAYTLKSGLFDDIGGFSYPKM